MKPDPIIVTDEQGRHRVQSRDGTRVYGAYRQLERAERRLRHVLNSSRQRRPYRSERRAGNVQG